MDDIVHMHDRLVPLLEFIESDASQILGQDKFKNIEKFSGYKKLGCKLYFPTTRGDVQYLGNENGWCVNQNSHYTDGVIESGNILVGICENDGEATKDDVVALAHYLKHGERDYSLEQLRWSTKVKDTKNVDAANDFNHGLIISTIIEYLEEHRRIKEKEKKDAEKKNEPVK